MISTLKVVLTSVPLIFNGVTVDDVAGTFQEYSLTNIKKEFDLKIDQYTFRIKFNEEFEVWRVLVNFSSGVSLSYSL